MARNLNVVVLIGNLTRDPELRALPSGSTVCNFAVAINEKFKSNASQEWQERVNYFEITAWGNQGEACAKYLRKGSAVAIDGRLRWESWEKDGQRRSKVTVVAESVQFLGDGRARERDESTEDLGTPISASDFGTPATATTPTPVRTYPDDDDIPF